MPKFPQHSTPKVRATLYVSIDVLDDARNAAFHLAGYPARMTLTKLVENALRTGQRGFERPIWAGATSHRATKTSKEADRLPRNIMSPKTKRFNKANSSDQPTGRIDPPAVTETVITLATSADRQRLRNELLRLIVRSESRRKRARQMRETQDVTMTEGSANSPIEAAEA